MLILSQRETTTTTKEVIQFIGILNLIIQRQSISNNFMERKEWSTGRRKYEKLMKWLDDGKESCGEIEVTWCVLSNLLWRLRQFSVSLCVCVCVDVPHSWVNIFFSFFVDGYGAFWPDFYVYIFSHGINCLLSIKFNFWTKKLSFDIYFFKNKKMLFRPKNPLI